MKTFQTICLVLSVVLLASCNPKQKEVKILEKNIGLQMYSLRDDINNDEVGIDEIIKVIGDMGYKYVETASYWDGMIYGMDPLTFKQKCADAGFYALSCHVNRDLGSDPLNPDWDAIWAWWDKCIATHKAAGMSYVVVPSMPTPNTLEGLKAYCDYYNAIGEKCNAAGMKFGYHNHAFEFEKVYDDGTVMYDYMVQNTDPAKVFFQLDVYWSEKGKRTASELFETYPKRFEVLHIKDEAELGESGFMNFPDIFNNVEKSGAKYLIVEVERYNLAPVQSVRKSLEFLNNADYVKENYAK